VGVYHPATCMGCGCVCSHGNPLSGSPNSSWLARGRSSSGFWRGLVSQQKSAQQQQAQMRLKTESEGPGTEDDRLRNRVGVALLLMAAGSCSASRGVAVAAPVSHRSQMVYTARPRSALRARGPPGGRPARRWHWAGWVAVAVRGLR
jgi:hypothetical protein